MFCSISSGVPLGVVPTSATVEEMIEQVTEFVTSASISEETISLWEGFSIALKISLGSTVGPNSSSIIPKSSESKKLELLLTIQDGVPGTGCHSSSLTSSSVLILIWVSNLFGRSPSKRLKFRLSHKEELKSNISERDSLSSVVVGVEGQELRPLSSPCWKRKHSSSVGKRISVSMNYWIRLSILPFG